MNKEGREGQQKKEGDISNVTMKEDTPVEMAAEMAKALNARGGGPTATKKKRKEGANYFENRTYHARDHDKSKLFMQDTQFEIKSGLPKNKRKIPGTNKFFTLNGCELGHFHHIYTSSHTKEENCAAVRLFPCACGPCAAQLRTEWDESIDDWKDQPRFHNRLDCWMGPNWKELNDWKFIKVGPVLPKKAGEKQTEKLQEYEDECRTHHDHLLGDYDMRGLAEIEVGKTGAMEGAVNSECPDGYYLIRWTGTAFRLTEPWEVEGCAEPMPVGTWVCKGRYI